MSEESDRLTREQIELIERIMHEQGEKLKFEQSAQKQLKTQQQQQQQRRQSTGSAAEEGRSLPVRSAESASNSTVKLTLTSVVVENNNIKLLLQKGNTSQVSEVCSLAITITEKLRSSLNDCYVPK